MKKIFALVFALLISGAQAQTISPAGTTAGGSNTQVQFNDSGLLGGSSLFTFDKTTGNLSTNNYFGKATSTVSAGGTTILTASSARYQALTGSSAQTFQLPDATTLQVGPAFVFNNNSSGSLTITNAGATTIYTVPAGGLATVGPTDISTANGVWDAHPSPPSTVTWGSGVTGFVMNTALSSTPSVSAGTPSATVPAFIPRRDAATTGIGASAAGTVSLIGAGVEAFRSSSTATTALLPLTVPAGTSGLGNLGVTVGTGGGIMSSGTGLLDIETSVSGRKVAQFLGGGVNFPSNVALNWTNATNSIGTVDTTLSRTAAGVLKLVGASGTGAGVVTTLPVATASLVSAATAGAGSRAVVTDALTCNAGTIVAGGSATCPVYSDGTNWNGYGTYARGQVPGTATNDNAAAGNVGEFVSSTVAAASPVALTTATPANITSISLTAGDWDVDISAYFKTTNTTTVQDFIASISTTTGTLDNTPGRDGKVSLNTASTGANVDYKIGAGPARLSLAATTTVYFVAECDYTASTCGAYGIISARRVR